MFFGLCVFVLQSFRSFGVERQIVSKLRLLLDYLTLLCAVLFLTPNSHCTSAFTLATRRNNDSTVYLLILFGIMGIFVSTIYVLLLHGFLGVNANEVSVMEGDSVTLHTGVKANQQGRIKWYFRDVLIAQISGDLSDTCTDVQCNKGTERFRDRLKLDHQTGSLTIMNITTTDSGLYQLEITSSNSGNNFIVSVYGVPAVEANEVKMNSVKEGENIMLHTGSVIAKKYFMMWYFNDNRLAYISGGPEIWKSPLRFSNRLELDRQTGSLSITNIKNTDSGVYKLEITNSSSINPLLTISSSRVKRFHVTVIDSALSSAAIAGICVGASVVVLVVVTAAVLIYCYCRTSTYGPANKNASKQNFKDEKLKRKHVSNNQRQMEASGDENE